MCSKMLTAFGDSDQFVNAQLLLQASVAYQQWQFFIGAIVAKPPNYEKRRVYPHQNSKVVRLYLY